MDIKIRLYDSKNKKMINNLICFYQPTDNHPRWGISWVNAFNPIEVDMDRANHPGYVWGFRDGEIPMLYTGLEDKNGKEIYVGDIVRAKYTGDFVVEGKDFSEWEVIFRDGAFGRKQMIETCGRDNRYWNEDVEVVGNIYQNS